MTRIRRELCLVVLTGAVLSGSHSAVAQNVADADDTPGVPVWCLDFSPDGSLLAAAGGKREGIASGVLQVWDMRDWSVALLLSEPRAATCVAFSPDKTKLAAGTQVGEVVIVDLATKKIDRRWPTGQWAVFGITWTPNGRDVISACASGVIKIWSAKSGTLKRTLDTWQSDGTVDPKLTGHSDRNLWDVTVSSDGKTLLSGGWNDTTRLWNLETGALLHALFETDKSTQGVKFTPDERFFVSIAIGKPACVRETKTLRVRAILPAAGRDIAVHPSGDLIAVATLKEVQIFQIHLKPLAEEEAARYKKLIGELGDDDIIVRDAASAELSGIGPRVEPVLFDALEVPDLELRSRVMKLWEERPAPRPQITLDRHRGEVRQVVFSPDGRYLASSTLEGQVRVWNTDRYKRHHAFTVTVPRLLPE